MSMAQLARKRTPIAGISSFGRKFTITTELAGDYKTKTHQPNPKKRVAICRRRGQSGRMVLPMFGTPDSAQPHGKLETTREEQNAHA